MKEITDIIKEEGDYHEWRDWSDSMTCFIQRNQLGAWCGYVIIPSSLPINYETTDYSRLNCHGGITYQSFNDNGDLIVGFDCSHAGDYVPKLKDFYEGESFSKLSIIYRETDVYRTKQYVIDEVNSLVEQILNIKEIKRHLRINNIINNDNQDK